MGGGSRLKIGAEGDNGGGGGAEDFKISGAQSPEDVTINYVSKNKKETKKNTQSRHRH